MQIRKVKKDVLNTRGITPGKYELIQSDSNKKKAQNSGVTNSMSKRAAIKKPFLGDEK